MKTSCLTIPEIEALLKDSGVQPSAQRIAICRYVLCEASHPTVEDVKKWADENFPKMSLATVYNTLNLLAEVGLLRSVKFPHMDKTIFDSNLEPHHHFLDDESGQIYDIEPSKVQMEFNLPEDFEITETQLIIRGRKRA